MTMQQYTSLLVVLGLLCFIAGVWVGIELRDAAEKRKESHGQH